MSIILEGIDIPKEGDHIVAVIKSNGKCSCWKQDTEYGICESMQTVEAIQIPTPHGRLIPLEDVFRAFPELEPYRQGLTGLTILEAEE